MEWIMLWLVCGVLSGAVATGKGRPREARGDEGLPVLRRDHQDGCPGLQVLRTGPARRSRTKSDRRVLGCLQALSESQQTEATSSGSCLVFPLFSPSEGGPRPFFIICARKTASLEAPSRGHL